MLSRPNSLILLLLDGLGRREDGRNSPMSLLDYSHDMDDLFEYAKDIGCHIQGQFDGLACLAPTMPAALAVRQPAKMH